MENTPSVYGKEMPQSHTTLPQHREEETQDTDSHIWALISKEDFNYQLLCFVIMRYVVELLLDLCFAAYITNVSVEDPCLVIILLCSTLYPF